MSIVDIIGIILTVVLFGVPLSAIFRLTVAAFSPRARISIRQRPVAHFIWFVGGFLAVLILFYCYAAGKADTRARFINSMNDLREAHVEFQQYGAFTNQFRHQVVYPFTNRFAINGTDYQCEFAIECDDFTNRGFLTITTNEMFVWVDKKRGVIPLVKSHTFPPGF
jgi:hypothetical protein